MIDIREKLLDLADDSYRRFNLKLIATRYPMVGVRVPMLKKMAKEVSEGGAIYEIPPSPLYEEVLLKGLTLGFMKDDIEARLQAFEAYLPHIDNWAICDLTCGGFRFKAQEEERVWEYSSKCAQGNEEYTIRIGIVMMLSHFVTERRIDSVLSIITAPRSDAYYVRMAAAWTLTDCFIRFPDKTRAYLDTCAVDAATLKMFAGKMRDSLRVLDDDKQWAARLAVVAREREHG